MPDKARSALEAELYRHLEERLDALELDMDADPEAVARILRHKGIKGRREKACHCPLAKYLAQGLPPSLIVHVDGWNAEVYPDVQDYLKHCTSLASIRLAQHISDFLYEFDAGSYPELVEEGGAS
jgi:hypothetical protein